MKLIASNCLLLAAGIQQSVFYYARNMTACDAMHDEKTAEEFISCEVIPADESTLVDMFSGNMFGLEIAKWHGERTLEGNIRSIFVEFHEPGQTHCDLTFNFLPGSNAGAKECRHFKYLTPAEQSHESIQKTHECGVSLGELAVAFITDGTVHPQEKFDLCSNQ